MQQDDTDAGSILADEAEEVKTEDAPEVDAEGEKNDEPDKGKSDDGEGSEDGESEGDAIEYDDFTIPEGFEVNDEAMEAFKTEAKAFNGGKGLSQEDAQKALDMHVKVMGEAVEAQQQQWTELTNGWLKEIKGDSEYGKDKFKNTQAEMMLAAQEYGSPELVEILKKEPAFANRPAFVKFMANVGRTLKEDTHQRGEPGKPKKGAAEILYGD